MKYLLMVITILMLALVACSMESTVLEPPPTFSEHSPASEVYEHILEPTYSLQEDEPVVESEENPEYENGEVEAAIHAVLDSQARFTSVWAKTDTHFFFTPGITSLSRLPLNNIALGERVDLPGEGRIEIVGIDEPYIFAARRTDAGYDWRQANRDTYRVCIITLEATLVDSGMYVSVPFFHAASNSILYVRADFDEGLAWLESFQLNTGIRHILYEFESEHFHFDPAWLQMENDAVVFRGGWGNPILIFVDSELYAQRIRFEDFTDASPQQEHIFSEADKILNERRAGMRTQIGDRIYYIWHDEEWRWDGQLHRINVDGTQDTLLQEDIRFSDLFSFNGLLFATICTGYGDDATLHEVVKLDEDGNIEKVLASVWIGHNHGFAMRKLLDTSIILIMQPVYYFLESEILGLYCTKTGALF